MFQLERREAGQDDAELMRPDRGQHVSRISGRRNVEPEHEAGRGLPLPEHCGASATPGREELDDCSCYGKVQW